MVLRRQASIFLAAPTVAVFLLVLSASARGQAPAEGVIDEDSDGSPYAAGELIVTYKDDASEKKVGEIRQESKAAVEEKFPEIDTQVLEFPGLKGERAQKVREQDLEQNQGPGHEDSARGQWSTEESCGSPAQGRRAVGFPQQQPNDRRLERTRDPRSRHHGRPGRQQ